VRFWWTLSVPDVSRRDDAGAECADDIKQVVTYDCVIGVNTRPKLKPGMNGGNVSIIIAQRDDVLNPNGALRFHPPKTDAATGPKPILLP